MNTESLVHYVSAIVTVLLASTLVLITTSDVTPPPSSPPPGGCADSVISFSPCLPFISAPPNDLSDEPSSQCCDIFNGAFASGKAECLCYLVRQNTLLGFPLNASKLLSLSDLCLLNNDTQASHANNASTSLQSICSGSTTLPPLISITRKPRSGSTARRSPPSSPTLRSPPPPPPPTSASKQPIPKPPKSERSNNGNHLAPAVALMPIYLGFFV
ncbi:non-specific lipid transfer protein GPI-anchored 25 [Lactuca sativa]|uniref:Bifunctional inhibitor/plant lipid transfer protein/seed storage helical domain-containing protein n=2 Tax=Lactuca TaxID=4235 RepID=A0A9R1WV07_LACSA|nr:non-specific lipid transfer protein GPI-anchored 25 [Lactuca sativa]KAJ0187479.1 hypothetical protein LSAT_V11C900488820 [Lactuca sativa]CAH1444078.1 unnamed protein product [Lactuca virosa]